MDGGSESGNAPFGRFQGYGYSIDRWAATIYIGLMKGKAHAKVVVVGAGPVGLATAYTLDQRNIPVEVIERDDRPGTHSYALALHPSTLAQLRQWGMSGKLEQSSLAVNTLSFCDRKGPQFELDLRQVEGYEAGLLVVGQDHLEEALIGPLEKSGINVHWNHRLSGLVQDESGVDLELERLSEGMQGYAMGRLEWQVDAELKRRAEYVIGADGHFSMVRRRMNIEFPKVGPTQSFAVFEFKTDFPHGNKAHVVFGEEGTNILWPLPGGYCRWGFEIDETAAEQYSRDKDRLFMQVGSQGFSSLEGNMLQSLIEERAPWFSGSIDRFRWRMIVRFEKRLADTFGKGRVWLAGDAGHMAAPIGMQSMNVGIHEGHSLANRIADLIEGKGDAQSLQDYASERQEEWSALMGLNTRLSPMGSANPFMAQYADRILGCIPGSRDSLPTFAKLLEMTLAAKA
jgi:2-polyprenyl-6-methoxyphenol hydroxylase-like FAD-dependent oxidoreductase